VIPVKQAHLRIAVRTHPGMHGKNNEDRFAITAHQVSESDTRRSLLLVVADGVGGHQAGEIAAEIAVEEISRLVNASDAADPVTDISTAIIHTSQKIQKQAKTDSLHKGMGSTCVCAWIIEDKLYTASAGDSRLYLLRAGEIHQLSFDHTWIQEALDLGFLTPEQAVDHPNQHIIRRYLGSPKIVEPDLRLRLHPDENDEQARANQGLRLLPGDKLVLCTDGLSDLVAEAEIQAAFQQNTLEPALDNLVGLANARGGHDNITIVAAEFPGADLSASAEKKNRPAFGLPLLLIFGGILFCLFIFVLAAVLYQITSQLFGFGG
jgi:PPM family protein phosphatase